MSALTPIGPVAPQARLRFPAYSVAGLAGTSFKHEHLQAIIHQGKHEGFFEVHAENYMGAGGRPTARSSRSVEIIRSRFTAFACRSAVRNLWISVILSASDRSLPAMNPRWYPSISPGRRTRPPTSTTSCRCRTLRRLWRASRTTSTRSSTPSVDRSCWKTLQHISPLANPRCRRPTFFARWPGQRVRIAARRQQRLRIRDEPGLLPRRLSCRLPAEPCGRDPSRRSCRASR